MAEASTDVVVGDDGETFPLTELLTGRGFVTGKSGSGKSNTASVIAEELLEQSLPLLVVDTDGEYYGLKAEFEMLQIGPGSSCDVDMGLESAREIAELALVENVPVILDTSGFVEQSDAEAMIDEVLKQLFALENDHQKPFLVLVEELHEFVPEQSGLPDVGETIIRVAKRGRKRGLGICGMSQRPAAVDKDYITQCNWLVWHRLTWENDTRIVQQIMGGDAAETVQSLGDGEALVMTDWDERTRRLQFRRKRTFDAGSTPSLTEGEQPSLKSVDDELLARLEGRPGADETTSDGGTDDAGEEDADGDQADADRGDTADSSDGRRSSVSAGGNTSTGENGALWEFGQLAWHLLARAGVASLRAGRWLGRQTERWLRDAAGTVAVARTRALSDGSGSRHARQPAPVATDWAVLLAVGLALLALVALAL